VNTIMDLVSLNLRNFNKYGAADECSLAYAQCSSIRTVERISFVILQLANDLAQGIKLVIYIRKVLIRILPRAPDILSEVLVKFAQSLQ
jgi:hypothetical protein